MAGRTFFTYTVPPGGDLDCRIMIIRPEDDPTDKFMRGALRRIVAERQRCRSCFVPLSEEMLGCVVMAMPPHTGKEQVSSVIVGICCDCDDSADRDYAGRLAADLAADPEQRALVHVRPDEDDRTARPIKTRKLSKCR
jgi:hypothetical protein